MPEDLNAEQIAERERQYVSRRKREIAEQKALDERFEVPSAAWQAQYDFWTRIISDEVARRRWNEGFESLEVTLYELDNPFGNVRKFVGTATVCGRDFWCSAYPHTDSDGRPILKLSIRVSPRKHH